MEKFEKNANYEITFFKFAIITSNCIHLKAPQSPQKQNMFGIYLIIHLCQLVKLGIRKRK